MMLPVAQFAQTMVTSCIIRRANGPSRPGGHLGEFLEPARGSTSPVWVAVGSNGMCGIALTYCKYDGACTDTTTEAGTGQ